MAWRGTFFGNTIELLDGVEGYFSLAGVGIAGQVPTINDVTTTTQVSFRASTYLGRITFFGQDLSTGAVNLPGGTSFPVLTSGTISGIELEYNYTQARARDQGIFDVSLHLPSLLEPSASISLPNVSATALSNAIVQSYRQGATTPFERFMASDSHVYQGDAGANIMVSWDGNDILRGGDGNDALDGKGGDDILDGGAGNDALVGGEGSDLYLPGSAPTNFGFGDSVSDGGTGPNDVDTVSYQNAPGPVTIDLHFLDGDQSAGWAKGLQASGIERAIGSRFDDTIIGTDFPESIADTPSDTLIGGEGDDTLVGLSGSDFLQGGPGLDRLRGGANGEIRGPGPGDVAVFSAPSGQIELFFQQDGSVLAAAPGAGIDLLINMEFIGASDGIFALNAFQPSSRGLRIGTEGGDTLIGTAGADLIYGWDSADTLEGGGAADRIEGGDGNDLVRGGGGGDLIHAENGNDRVLAGGGNDVVSGGRGNDTLLGDKGNDRLEGGPGKDDIGGGTGKDTLFGGAGNDKLKGNEKADRLEGGAGKDTLIGGKGDDTLDGGSGKDTLEGGKGVDTFRFGPGDQRATILDFSDDQDVLMLDDALWQGTLGPGKIVRRFGEERKGDAILDFGSETVRVNGIDLGDLRDDLQIV